MGFLDKMKNLFTEEVEEEIRPIKRETRSVSEPTTRRERLETLTPKKIEVEKEEPKKDEKFVFFSDDDFKDLEKKKEEPKKEKKVEAYGGRREQRLEQKEEKLPYRGATPQVKIEPKKQFKSSPIISPVYGVLDKNYKKNELPVQKIRTRPYKKEEMTIDDIRNKAYGTVEDDIKDNLLGRAFLEEVEKEPKEENDIDIFAELERYELENPKKQEKNIDELFGKLDNKKEEILGELDNKKDQILDELDIRKTDILEDEKIETTLEDVDDETLELSKQLEEQEKKLKELSSMIDDASVEEKTDDLEVSNLDDANLDESELFNLIDSMYEKKDGEE